MFDYDKNIDFDYSKYFDTEGNILPEDKNPIFSELGLTSLKKYKDGEVQKLIKKFLRKETIITPPFYFLFVITPIIIILFSLFFYYFSAIISLKNTIVVLILGNITISTIMYSIFCYFTSVNYKTLKKIIFKEIEFRKRLSQILKKYKKAIDSNVLDKENRIFAEKIFLIMNSVFKLRLEFTELSELDFIDAYLEDCFNKSSNSTLTGQWLCENLEKTYIWDTIQEIYPFLSYIREHPSDLSSTAWSYYLKVNYLASNLNSCLKYSSIYKMRIHKDCFKFIVLGSNLQKCKYLGIQSIQIEKVLSDIRDLLQFNASLDSISPKYETGETL